jgi:hypothetical protein
MKLKFYINARVLMLILFSVVIVLLLINNSSATLLTSSATPTSIFKCGASTITSTVSDTGITSFNATLSSLRPVQPMMPGSGRTGFETQSTIINMTNISGVWTGTFGNDATLLWGTRSITYNVTNTTGSHVYSSSTTLFVYSDACVGTNKQNYTQINPTGMGNYTSRLWTSDMNLLTFALYPWIQYWGYLFYLLVIGTIVSVLYLKTQNIVQPLVIGLLLLLLAAGTTIVPPTWRNGIVFLIALMLTVIYYRLFTRE